MVPEIQYEPLDPGIDLLRLPEAVASYQRSEPPESRLPSLAASRRESMQPSMASASQGDPERAAPQVTGQEAPGARRPSRTGQKISTSKRGRTSNQEKCRDGSSTSTSRGSTRDSSGSNIRARANNPGCIWPDRDRKRWITTNRPSKRAPGEPPRSVSI